MGYNNPVEKREYNMKICGVELKGSEAIVCLLSFKDGLFNLPECRVRKVEFNKRNSTGDIRYFQSTFSKLMADYGIDSVVIKERPLKALMLRPCHLRFLKNQLNVIRLSFRLLRPA